MSGDDPDFLEFFAGEFWPLRRVGFLLTGDWDQAEELAQEAMARTWAAWPRVRGYDRPAAFARKVLLNRHRSLLRRAGSRSAPSPTSAATTWSCGRPCAASRPASGRRSCSAST